MRWSRALAIALAVVANAAGAQPRDEVPFFDVPARRTADGSAVVASAVGMPDERLPMIEPRCAAARRLGERRARRMIHDYVDDALRTSAATPSQIDAAQRAVDSHAQVTGTRSLADCGAVVRVALPLAALEATVRGIEVTFP